MFEQQTPMQRLAQVIDGAAYVRYHEDTRRVFVWRSGPLIDVVRVDNGQVLGNWPLADESPEAAANVVTERVAAGY